MKKAILTELGAARIARPDLSGEVVEYDVLNQFGCAKNVYYEGHRICGVLSTTGHEKGLELKVGIDNH
jgi:hypothetical protein